MPRFPCATALLLSVVCTQAVCSETPARRAAPLMPLAAESLLLDIATAGDRLVAAGERGHVLYSDDAGHQWRQAMVPTTQMLTAVHFVNASLGWSVGHDGLILTSDDGGATWRIQRDGLAVQHQQNIEQREAALRRLRSLQAQLDAAAPDTPPTTLESAIEDARMDLEDAELALDEPVFTAPLLDVWFDDENRGWAVGAFGTLVATSDGGQHWSDHSDRLDNPDEFHLNAIIGDGRGRVFIAGEGGVMFRSDDAGATWESIEPFYEGSWFGLVYEPVSETLLVFGLRGN
ncbi:MAG: hypothetical protein KDI09_10010, partial [Halioglobus sp.]|nr:hypothetical protein [Halioglobus sp.]